MSVYIFFSYFLDIKQHIREGLKKWNFPLRGSVSPDFPLKKVLKHCIFCLKIILKHLFFSIFGWGDPYQLGSWSEGCVKPLKLSRKAIWQVSEDPYHTEFVSWRVDHFSFFYFFSTRGGGQTLSGKFHYFFLFFF